MNRSLKSISLVVSAGTILSKFGGMARQILIAGVFGVGSAYDAYNYAYVIPGFFLVLLGGINGPFHNAIVSVVSRRNQKETAHLISSINIITSTILIFTSLFIILAANPIISLIGPGLNTNIHEIAVLQLQIMAPIAFLSGLIGIGFGALNARDEFFIPAISPLISSLSLIVFVGSFWLLEGPTNQSTNIQLAGGIILALGTLIGALLQWIIQLPKMINNRIKKIKFDFNLRDSGVREVLNILGPATLSSGMLQINVFTDLFFASAIVGAASGLSYANFLIQAPLGIISNALIIPLIPTFAKLTKPKDREKLIYRIRQGIMIACISMVYLGSIFVAIGPDFVSLIYKRGAFQANAVELVGGLLIAYGIGMPAYLCRDLLVRVFYAIGNSKIPFKYSTIGIGLNIIFDWLFVGGPTPWGYQLPFNFGAKGLVLATVMINFTTCIMLIIKLNILLKKIPIKNWVHDIIKIIFAGFAGGFTAWLTIKGMAWQDTFLGQLSELSIASLISILVFLSIGNYFKVPEIQEIVKVIRTKLILK